MVVPQPDAVVRMASTPSPSISFIHTVILRRAAACAAVSSPMWWASDPQHLSPVAITTSKPWRLRTRIADALISGARALATQPDNSGTRPRRGHGAGKDFCDRDGPRGNRAGAR